MPKGHKTFMLRGGVDHNDFPSREVSLRDVRAIGRSPWGKWGHMVADHPLRDLVALAYVEGLYHGAMIGIRDEKLRSTIGMTPDLASPVVASAASSRTIEIETPSVRDLLESI
jgi:hypothetical protein